MEKRELEEQSRNHKIPFIEYYNKLKWYLKIYPEDVEFKFSNGVFGINVLLENKMKLLYFNTSLREVDFATNIFNLLDDLYLNKVTILKEIDDIKIKYESLQKENQEVVEKLNNFIERKKSEEEELFSKFIVLLNEKKHQIQHLNDTLIAFKQGRPTINSNNTAPKVIKIKKANKNSNKSSTILNEVQQASSSSDESYKTDDENNSNNRNDKSSFHKMLEFPSTSKLTPPFEDDTFKLRKRVRTVDKADFNTNLLSKSSTNHEQIDTDSFNKIKTEKLPVVDFNTQDILDNL